MRGEYGFRPAHAFGVKSKLLRGDYIGDYICMHIYIYMYMVWGLGFRA